MNPAPVVRIVGALLLCVACGSKPPPSRTPGDITEVDAPPQDQPGWLLRSTAKATGCARDEIKVSDKDHSFSKGTRWRAACGGVSYQCSTTNAGMHGGMVYGGVHCEAETTPLDADGPRTRVAHTTEPNGAKGVSGTFRLENRASLVIRGTPALSLGALVLELSTPRPYAQRDQCAELSIVVDRQVGAGSKVATVDNVGAAQISASFDFEMFKPLADAGAAFAVRRCDTEYVFDIEQRRALRELLAHYSKLAIDVQAKAQ